jgi:hypothetical protein
MSQCRSCKAELLWCKTLTGKNIPVDLVPVPGGNIEIQVVKGKQVVVVHESNPDITRYVSHFATCPNAKEHRR